MASEADRHPRHYAQQMQTRLQEMMDHPREDIDKVDEPQLKCRVACKRRSATKSKSTRAPGAAERCARPGRRRGGPKLQTSKDRV